MCTDTAAPATLLEWILEKVAGPLIAGLILALLGGWLIAQINERYRARRDLYFKAADSLRTSLATLQKASSTYWSTNYGKESVCAEAELEFLLSDVSDMTRACTGALWRRENDEGPRLLGELFIAVTGNPSYGSKSRKSDPAAIRNISESAAKLSAFVSDSKSEYFRGGAIKKITRELGYIYNRLRRPIVVVSVLFSCLIANSSWHH